MEQQQRRSFLFTLYLAYFADYFSWGAAIAFIAVYITSENTPFTQLFWNSQISLGIAIAAFPLGEVIGSPILGDLSDLLGRKKVLQAGTWCSLFSMALCAFSLWIGNFILFLITQTLIGFFSGKQSMAHAAIVEINGPSKGPRVAFLSVLGCCAWILGPFSGGLLMEEPFISYGGFIWPSILSCCVYALSLVCTYYLFTDDYVSQNATFSPSKFLKNIGNVFVLTWKQRLFFLFFLNLLGWYLLIVSLSDFLILRFNFTSAQVGFFNNYLSLCFMVGGLIGILWLLYRWKAKNILLWTLISGSLGLFLVFGAEKVMELWIYLAIPAFTESWIYPAYQTVLSDRSGENNQGKLFGLIGASNGTCQFAASIILGGFSSQLAIGVAALLFLGSGLLLPSVIRRKKAQA